VDGASVVYGGSFSEPSERYGHEQHNGVPPLPGTVRRHGRPVPRLRTLAPQPGLRRRRVAATQRGGSPLRL